MSTYGTMQTRIADELSRSDLPSQIKLAIQSAIEHYENERFLFNETRATASTADGTEYYDFPSDLIALDTVKVTVNSNDYTLKKRSWAYLDDLRVSPNFTGYPYDYAIRGQQFRLYPIPNGTYTLTVAYMKQLTVLSAGGDTNEWMTDGEELIRCRAKWDLYTHVIKNLNEARAMSVAAKDAYDSLKSKTDNQTTTGEIEPYCI